VVLVCLCAVAIAAPEINSGVIPLQPDQPAASDTTTTAPPAAAVTDNNSVPPANDASIPAPATGNAEPSQQQEQQQPAVATATDVKDASPQAENQNPATPPVATQESTAAVAAEVPAIGAKETSTVSEPAIEAAPASSAVTDNTAAAAAPVTEGAPAPVVAADADVAAKEAKEMAKKDLQKALQKVQPVMLATTPSKSMMVTWYGDSSCNSDVKGTSVLSATATCQYLPAYVIPTVKSAMVECSLANDRGDVTFYDTPCDAAGSSRVATASITDANCVQFPGELYYVKINWCRDDPSNSASTPVAYGLFSSLLALLATMLWL